MKSKQTNSGLVKVGYLFVNYKRKVFEVNALMWPIYDKDDMNTIPVYSAIG